MTSFVLKILSDRHEFAMTHNARKRGFCLVTYDLIGLLPTNHIIIMAYQGRLCQTTQKSWKFIVGKWVYRRNGKLRRLSGRFHTLIWRPEDTVQNLESPGFSGRVVSIIFLSSFYMLKISKIGFLLFWYRMRGGFKENISPNSLRQFWHHTTKIDAKK